MGGSCCHRVVVIIVIIVFSWINFLLPGLTSSSSSDDYLNFPPPESLLPRDFFAAKYSLCADFDGREDDCLNILDDRCTYIPKAAAAAAQRMGGTTTTNRMGGDSSSFGGLCVVKVTFLANMLETACMRQSRGTTISVARDLHRQRILSTSQLHSIRTRFDLTTCNAICYPFFYFLANLLYTQHHHHNTCHHHFPTTMEQTTTEDFSYFSPSPNPNLPFLTHAEHLYLDTFQTTTNPNQRSNDHQTTRRDWTNLTLPEQLLAVLQFMCNS